MSLMMRIVKALAAAVCTTALIIAVCVALAYLIQTAGDGVTMVVLIFAAVAITAFLALED